MDPALSAWRVMLVGLDALFAQSFSDELFGKLAALHISHHPTDHIATENIENRVEGIMFRSVRSAQRTNTP